ncbi:MAG TPA: hypothetical protein VG367_04915 [Mucilaginibacter sp.]|nr:hypothetical protein [Mucilaginibacter sp.]
MNNLNFETWCRNHNPDHADKWYRELYPYNVFRKINFSEDQIGIEQNIIFNYIIYKAFIRKIEWQISKCSYRCTFDLSTSIMSEYKKWKEISWNLRFQIIYGSNGDFITVFKKEDDPSEVHVKNFIQGKFDKIFANKSLPLSDLLIRSLILNLSEENFNIGAHDIEFDFVPNGIRNLIPHDQFKSRRNSFSPLYSIGRELWITYAFTEEKAHRIAFYIANQCKKLYVIYCNSSYTPHHRCDYADTEIISLYQFANILNPELQLNFEPQIRFLQNHLNLNEKHEKEVLLNEINNPLKETYEITKSDLMEALGIMKIMPSTIHGVFYSLAAMNLINAWVGKQRNSGTTKKEERLFKNMYYFKSYLSNIISNLILQKVDFVSIYITNELCMIELLGFQFSFHNVPKNDIILSYEHSTANKEIIWCKKKLQPIAPLIFELSKIMKREQ